MNGPALHVYGMRSSESRPGESGPGLSDLEKIVSRPQVTFDVHNAAKNYMKIIDLGPYKLL